MNELRDIRQRFRELRATAMSAAGANHALDKDLFTLAEKTEAYVTEARAIALSLRAGPLPSGRGSCWGGGLRLEDEVEDLWALSADLEVYQATIEDALITSGRVLEAIERFDKLKL